MKLHNTQGTDGMRGLHEYWFQSIRGDESGAEMLLSCCLGQSRCLGMRLLTSGTWWFSCNLHRSTSQPTEVAQWWDAAWAGKEVERRAKTMLNTHQRPGVHVLFSVLRQRLPTSMIALLTTAAFVSATLASTLGVAT
jgi:hypothetical protein